MSILPGLCRLERQVGWSRAGRRARKPPPFNGVPCGRPIVAGCPPVAGRNSTNGGSGVEWTRTGRGPVSVHLSRVESHGRAMVDDHPQIMRQCANASDGAGSMKKWWTTKRSCPPYLATTAGLRPFSLALIALLPRNIYRRLNETFTPPNMDPTPIDVKKKGGQRMKDARYIQ